MKSKINGVLVFISIACLALTRCLPAVGAEGIRFSGRLEATTYQNAYGGQIYFFDCLPVRTPIGLSPSPDSPACLTADGKIIEGNHHVPEIDRVQISGNIISWEQKIDPNDPLNCTADLGEIKTSSEPAPGQPNDEIRGVSVNYEVTCRGMEK